MFKTLLTGGCALALAFSLSACVSPSAVTGVTAATPGISVEALKEVNRHIETCDRTYAWPLAVTIICHAQTPGAAPTTTTSGLTAAEISTMIDAAVAKAIAALKAPPPLAVAH